MNAPVNPFANPSSTPTQPFAAAPAQTTQAQPAADTQVQTAQAVQAPAPAPAPVQQVQAPAPAPVQQAFPQAAAPTISGEVSFDSDIKFNRLDRFASMKQDEITRLAFMLKDAKGKPRLRMTQVFYDNANRKSYVAPDNPALIKQMAEKFGDSRPRFATVVAVYTTNLQGQVLTQDIRLQAFIFGGDKFNDLKMLDQQWGLCTRDLMVQCKEANFQKLTFTPCPDRLMAMIPGLEQSKLEEAETLFGRPLDMFLGKKLSEQDYMALLSGRQPGAPMGAPGGVPAANPFGAPPAGGASPFGAGTASVAQQQANFGDLVAQGQVPQ